MAALQAQFNERAGQLSGTHGNDLLKACGEQNNGNDRYDDQFYHDMTEYYEHRPTKHDSPTTRLVKQKDVTIKAKLADPNNRDKQLYTNESNLKKA